MFLDQVSNMPTINQKISRCVVNSSLAYQQDFVAFCHCSLRFLNASANKLETLPPATLSEETNSILQELYLTKNNLTDKCVPLLTGHPHLKILHMAYNRLQSFPAR